MTTFTWNSMQFEIVKDQQYATSMIRLSGKLNRIICWNLPLDITEDQARLVLQGFVDGMEFCESRMRLEKPVLQRLYHSGEEK